MTVLKHFYSDDVKSFNPPLVQCHRGYWVDGLPQNSLLSIKRAYELGYKMAEFDVRITSDKHVILYHDDLIGSRKVSDMTLAEVSTYQSVDSFESLINWFVGLPQGDFYLNIEIKSKFALDRTLEGKVLEVLKKYKVESRVLISSFNPLSLFYFRMKASNILRALLLTFESEPGNGFLLKSQMLNILAYPHFLHLNENNWSEDKFKPLLKRGVSIVLWTCNDLNKVKSYFFQGVYGVISDTLKPDEVKK